MINDVLGEAGISLNDLSAVAVCGGPGSYTGLRIGMATAKGLCYALDKPLVVDNRLTSLAYHAYKMHPGCTQYITLLTARDKEYFVSIYDHDFTCILAPQHVMEDQLPQLVSKKDNAFIVSNAPDYIFNTLLINNLQIDSNTKTDLASWCWYGFLEFNCNNIVNLSTAEPFYLKQVYTHK